MKVTKRKLAPTEADILKAIQDYLDLLQAQGKLLYIRHSPSNVIGKKGEAKFRKPRQSQLGAADLIVFKRTRDGNCNVLCLEVKSSTGQLRPAQSRWCGLALGQGMRYVTVRSFEDGKKAIDNY